MLRITRVGIAAAAIGVATLVAGQLAAQDGADLVKQRQDQMKEMGKSFGPLVAVVRGESSDFAAAAAGAQTMNTNAAKIIENHPEGSGREAVSETRAKPAVWSERAEFEAAARALVDESAKMVEVAQTEDPDAFGTQFQALGKACGACHSGKGAEGGKFRFAKDE